MGDGRKADRRWSLVRGAGAGCGDAWRWLRLGKRKAKKRGWSPAAVGAAGPAVGRKKKLKKEVGFFPPLDSAFVSTRLFFPNQ